jgi:hypothetical protein
MTRIKWVSEEQMTELVEKLTRGRYNTITQNVHNLPTDYVDMYDETGHYEVRVAKTELMKALV